MSINEFREQILRTIRKNLSETSEGVIIAIKVETGHEENNLTIEGDELIFRTREAGEGKLNSVLVGFLSRELRIPSSRIDIVYGLRSHVKRILIKYVNVEDLEKRLLRTIRLI